MTPEQVLDTYLAIKLHFTSDYDYFKYQGKLKPRKGTYEDRNDRGHIFILSRKYRSEEIEGLFVSNMLRNSDTWIGAINSSEGKECYDKWLAFNQALTYNVGNELKSLKEEGHTFSKLTEVIEGQHPILLKCCLAERVHLETLVVLDQMLNITLPWNEQIQDTVIWPQTFKRIKKYSPFVKYEKRKLAKVVLHIFFPDKEYITAAAILYADVIHSVPAPGRHNSVMERMCHEGLGLGTVGNQGFVTNKGRFVSREEACKIAMAADQLKPNAPGRSTGVLHTEDLW